MNLEDADVPDLVSALADRLEHPDLTTRDCFLSAVTLLAECMDLQLDITEYDL